MMGLGFMEDLFAIDKGGAGPVYRNIADRIEALIASGELSPGEKLPTERALGAKLNVARGTVTNAYALLKARGLVSIVQGSGAYVVDLRAQQEVEREIDAVLERICGRQLTLPQIEAIFHERLWKRAGQEKKVRVAWVDCCAETLAIPDSQLSQMENLEIAEYLLDDILSNRESVGSDYDIVVTTARHFEELIAQKPELLLSTEKVMMTLSTSTIIELAKIPRGSKAVIWCQTQTFAEIIRSNLREFENIPDARAFTAASDADEVQEALLGADVLIVHQNYLYGEHVRVLEAIKRFEARGGHLILFEYQLDRGSLIHFEALVHRLWAEKNREER